jgi:hypothetical protein
VVGFADGHNERTTMKTQNTRWTAGVDLRPAAPPPPPPHHPHPNGPKPHEVIIDGLQAISAQIEELGAAVEEIRAGKSGAAQ